MKLLRIETVADLRRSSAAWDDLWWRSNAYLPTQRAEMLAQWLEQFDGDDSFIALAVESDGQLVIRYVAIPKTPEQELTWLQRLMILGKLPKPPEEIPAKTVINL